MTTIVCTIAIYHSKLQETLMTSSASGNTLDIALNCACVFTEIDAKTIAQSVYMYAPKDFLNKTYPKSYYHYITQLLGDSVSAKDVIAELNKLPNLSVHVFYNVY